jgi:hypothetical protein
MHPGSHGQRPTRVEGVAPATVFPYRAKNDFIILTISDHYDTIADIRIWSPFGLERVPLHGSCLHRNSGKQRQNSGRLAAPSVAVPSPVQDFRGERDLDG